MIRAAGGVVCRERAGGGREVLVVHRPKYDDWTLPKGKAKDGETDEACALREVEEETGLACALGPELASSTYLASLGRPKTVRYWVMGPLSGSFEPQAEVDAVRWLPVEDAAALLTHDRDRRVLASLP